MRDKEARVLYIAIILILLGVVYVWQRNNNELIKSTHQRGVAEGKLIKMEIQYPYSGVIVEGGDSIEYPAHIINPKYLVGR